jgi:hypothetical protein
MHFDLGHHSKSRTRSVQLQKDFSMPSEVPAPRPETAKENHSAPSGPIPSARSSSLPGIKDINGARQYRSMLDVEAPPSLGPLKTLDYGELYIPGSRSPTSQQSLVVALHCGAFLACLNQILLAHFLTVDLAAANGVAGSPPQTRASPAPPANCESRISSLLSLLGPRMCLLTVDLNEQLLRTRPGTLSAGS